MKRHKSKSFVLSRRTLSRRQTETTMSGRSRVDGRNRKMKNAWKKFLTAVSLIGTAVCLGVGGMLLNNGKTVTKVSAATLSSFKITESAGVRVNSPNGIRFTTTIDDETRAIAADLESKGYTVTYGALLCRTDLLGSGELTFEDLDDKLECDIPTEVWAEEGVTYNSVLSGYKDAEGNIQDIPESYYHRAISARGYMKAVSSKETVYYYTANTAERSLGYVATMALANGETATAQLEKLAQNTVFGLVPDLTLTTKAEESGTLLSNVYKSSSEEYALVTLDGIPAYLPGVTYSVDNETVATVKNGVVTAKAAGTTTLTATYTQNGTEITKSALLTVGEAFKGESEYRILIPVNASAKVVSAAQKLQSVFAQATGVSLPIMEETGYESTTGKYISLGETNLAQGIGSLSVTKQTASEVKTVGNTLFLRGRTDTATLYGVQQLLGDLVGYDYYMKNTYSVDTVQTALALPGDKTYSPDVEYNFLDQNSDVSQEYAMQMFYDGLGQVKSGIDRLHNSVSVLDPDTYYSSNQDWYATEKKWSWSSLSYKNVLIETNAGKAAELCYTAHGNATAYQNMLNTASQAIVAAFQADSSLNKLSFSIADGNYGWCDCSTSSAAGNASDNLLNFLNDLCAKVETGLSGDPRQSTFRLLTLAYHQTNVAPSKVASINSHIEVWFGDSYGDYTKALNGTGSDKNAEIYANFQGWSSLVGDADMLLWAYYSNTKCGFAPYNTFAAMRANYAMAAAAGVDYMFNQTMQARSVWTMLKLYLASQLAWNSTPTDAEWENWISSYFTAAYGQGAAKMLEWFNDWRDDDTSLYATSNSDPAIHRNIVNSNYFASATLEKWVGYANAALAALDTNDANYQTYYNNILLEKISPEYLLMEIYGDYGTNFVYASDFVNGVNTWNITNLGEAVTIDATLAKYQEVLAERTITVDTEFYAEKQDDGNYVVVIEDANITAGSYTVTATGATVVSSAATDGQLTVTLNGVTERTTTYTVVATAADGSITKFTNVLAVTKAIRTVADLSVLADGYSGRTEAITGYYVLANDIDAQDTRVVAGYTWDSIGFAGTFDGRGRTISNLRAGTTGIFGEMFGGTVQNINFTDVTICNEWGAALFAVIFQNSKILNVTVTYKDILATDSTVSGLLVSRLTAGNYTQMQNVTLDATGLYVPCIFGSQATFTGTNVVINNVTVYADSYKAIAYTDSGTATPVEAWPTGVTYVDTLPEVRIADAYVAEEGALTLTHAAFTVNKTVSVKANDVTKEVTVTKEGELSVELSEYGITTNGTYTVSVTLEDGILAFTNVTANYRTVYQVTAPASSAYYTFTGNGTVEKGSDYTFTVTGKVEGLNDFVVFVNEEEIAGENGSYTVQNVQSDLTITVLHGYIEVASTATATVAYSGSTITITKSWGNSHAYISAEYIDYMRNKGYTSVTFTYAPDGEIAAQALCMYNGVNKAFVTDPAGASVNITLEDVSSAIYFWGQNSAGSGYQIREQNFYVTITGLRFVKPAQNVEVTTEMYADVGGTALLFSEKFAVGDTYTVTVGSENVNATVTTAGQLSVALTTLTAGTSYSVLCSGSDYKITFTKVFAATKVIRTAEDLSVVTVDKTATANVTGYYVLGGNIDATGYTTTATGYGSYGFNGTFDGRGYTIDGITAGSCGLFGVIASGATIKDVNFTNVTLGTKTENYAALLAGKTGNLTMSNVSVTYKAVNLVTGDPYLHGLLISRATTGNYQNWSNITIDASNIVIDSIFGAETTSFIFPEAGTNKSSYKNITVKVGAGSTLGYTSGNKTTALTVENVPSGITVEYIDN